MSSKYLGILGISRLSYPKSGYVEDNEGPKKSRDNLRIQEKLRLSRFPPTPRIIPTCLDSSRLKSRCPLTRPEFWLRPPRSRFFKKSRRPTRSQSRFFKKSRRPPRSRSRPDSAQFLSRYYPPRDISPIPGTDTTQNKNNLKLADKARMVDCTM